MSRPRGYPPRPLPPQLSWQEAERLRAHELDRLPRLSRRPIVTPHAFELALDECIATGMEMREYFEPEPSKTRWARMVDVLDDLHDMFCAVHGEVYQDRLLVSPCVRLLGLCPDGVSMHERAHVMLSAKERDARERAQRVDCLSAPNIGSASRFVERLEAVALMLAGLREPSATAGEHDWGRWADLLDEVADLLDAVRPNGHYGTKPTLAVVDLPVLCGVPAKFEGY